MSLPASSRRQLVRFPSADGLSLEGRLTPGARDRGVVLCHPHPLYGGSMLTPVILTVETAFREAGFTTLAFNFRGVGASEGTHGEGQHRGGGRRGGARAPAGVARRGAAPGCRCGLLVRELRRRPRRRGRPRRRLLPRRRARGGPLRLRLPGGDPRARRAHRAGARTSTPTRRGSRRWRRACRSGRGSACSRRTTSSVARWRISPPRVETRSPGQPPNARLGCALLAIGGLDAPPSRCDARAVTSGAR